MLEDEPFEDIPDVKEDLACAEQRLWVHVEERRYGKAVIIVE